MIAAPIHPVDLPKLRRLGEMLWEISAGELTTRDATTPDECRVNAAFGPLVKNLMVCTRDDCSAAEAESVIDRLLVIADHRLGADILAELALAELLAPPSAHPDGIGARHARQWAEEAAPKLELLRQWALPPYSWPPGFGESIDG